MYRIMDCGLTSKNGVLLCALFLLFFVSCSVSSPAEKTFSVVIQFNATCYDSSMVPNEIKRMLENDDYVFTGTEATAEQIQTLNKNTCVVRTFKPSELSTVLGDIQGDLDKDRDKQFQQQKIKRVLEERDVTGKDELKQYLQEKHQKLPSTIISEYQLYVTPDADAIQELAATLNGTQEIYNEALSWVWVSEEYLNGVPEYWYTPEEFLTITPTLKTNPSKGIQASDCSEQANTLASLLLASGVDAKNVRVVLGKVNFDGQIGGHAWVEIYENEQWIPLEATAGAYYYEDTDRVSPAQNISYMYFRYHSYPVVEVWYYYNNIYFRDVTKRAGTGNFPENWKKSSRSYLRDELETFDSSQRRTYPKGQ